MATVLESSVNRRSFQRRGAVDASGLWTFHCHILTHAEGHAGMFGMVNTLIVQD